LSKLWASCFGNDCGCSSGASDCGCTSSASGAGVGAPGSIEMLPGPRLDPTFNERLPADTAPPAPKVSPDDESSARRLFPTFRGFGSGLK
jgi:hypothetical protein